MDQRLRFAWYITVFAGIIILCVQFIYLYSLYNQEKDTYTYTQNNRLQCAIYEFNIKSTNPIKTGNWLRFNSEDNLLEYFIKGDTCQYHFDPKDDIAQVDIRAIYDIRDPEKWTLERFYTYLQAKLDSTVIQNLGIRLFIIDSTGQITDCYPKHTYLSPSCEYITSLGFISGNTLYATYQYPIDLFLKASCWHIVLITLMTLLLSFCIVNLYRTIRNEKKSGEYREQFIHNLVHDLKRPVENQIKLCYLLHDTQESEQANLLIQSETQLKEMLQSINRMLLQSTDAHGLRLNPKEFNLREMLETLTHPNRWRVEEGKEFRIKAPFLASHDTITGDSDFLYAVFQNFIDNSLKYSGQQVNIVITCKDIDDRHVQVEVKDNGFGISSEALKHIFERYHRGDHQGDKKIKGHGQGLYYARMIINAHRGHIAVDSTPGEGTTITITLPKTVKKKKR